MVQGSRSSLVKTASSEINRGQCKLISVHACASDVNGIVLKIHDCETTSDAAAGNEVLRLLVEPTTPQSQLCIEQDTHGILFTNGITAILTGNGNYTVVFQ